MALDKETLISALTDAFTPGDGSSPGSAAALIADAIEAYVSGATVLPGSFAVATAPGLVTGTGTIS